MLFVTAVRNIRTSAIPKLNTKDTMVFGEIFEAKSIVRATTKSAKNFAAIQTKIVSAKLNEKGVF
ncbi:MAG TPA: hypothetical protein DCS04_01030 [Ruminococcaceae bacterium]|nr:hypothetical protein [Oscillospiraceae bacterium]